MRRIFQTVLLIGVAIVFTLPTQAQRPKQKQAQRVTARTVAAQVQSFYNQTLTIETEFFQTYFYKLYNRYERSKGKVVFKKPGKMRWDYSRPNRKVIAADGQKLTIFDPGQKGEVPQLFERQLSEHQLPLAFSFLTGTGRLDQDFKFRLLPRRRNQQFPGNILELRPRKPSAHFERLLFYVSAGSTPGVVLRVLIIDATGNRNRFDFSKTKFNRTVPDSRFRYRAPAGTRRVQP